MKTDEKKIFELSQEEFEDLLGRAAKQGAAKALAEVGLEGKHAATDIRELRSLLQGFNLAKKTAWTTAIKFMTAGCLIALTAGIAIKFKLFSA